MAEYLVMLGPGERFATIDKNGNAIVWRVSNNGLPYDTLNDERKESMVKEPRHKADDVR